jgi:molecular chaperone GrpE
MAEPQENQTDTEAQTNQTDAQSEPSEPLDPVQALAEAEAAFEAERKEMKDRLLRTLADLENTRKRAEKDRRDAALYGGTKLARDLLPVYDNLNRALELVDDETRERAQGMVEGLDLTLRELTNIFAKHGIERISPQTGDSFDPHLHEAMFEAPVPGTSAGQIIQVVAEGFRLHEHLLRPAKVGVSSSPAG